MDTSSNTRDSSLHANTSEALDMGINEQALLTRQRGSECPSLVVTTSKQWDILHSMEDIPEYQTHGFPKPVSTRAVSVSLVCCCSAKSAAMLDMSGRVELGLVGCVHMVLMMEG